MNLNLKKPAPGKTVRMHDIAALAKTSVATVSMALSGDPRVKAETRQRILRLSRELSYQPKRSAREKVRRQAMPQERMHFGFLAIDRLDSPSSVSLFQHLSATAAAQDARLEVASVDADTDPHELVERAIQMGADVDGLIIMGRIKHEQLQQIQLAGVPAVMFGYPLGWADEQELPVPIISHDWRAMGHLATRTLLDQGHERVGFVSGSLIRGMWHDRCLDGYIMAHAHAGLALDRDRVYIIPGGADLDSAYCATAETVQAVLSQADAPTAYVLINFGNADRFLNAMHHAHVDLTPQQVAICGIPLRSSIYESQGYPLVVLDPAGLAEATLAQLRAKCMDRQSPNAAVLVPFATRNVSS